VVAEEQPSELLPDLAADALVRGLDSPSLRLLAGTRRQDVRDARDLFLSAVDELGWEPPSKEVALRTLALHWAEQMVSGEMKPHEAASRIWWRVANPLGKPDDLIVFVALAVEWDDHPEARPEIEDQMLDEARRLIAPR
jgi:hypothetical protein